MSWDELLKILTDLKASGVDMTKPVLVYSGDVYMEGIDIVQSGRTEKIFLVQEAGDEE